MRVTAEQLSVCGSFSRVRVFRQCLARPRVEKDDIVETRHYIRPGDGRDFIELSKMVTGDRGRRNENDQN